MAAPKFISDEKILPAIYDLIEQAQEELTIVSPYVNLWGHLVNKLDKSKAKEVLFIARKNQDGKLDEVIKKMNELRLEMIVVENLHAKIYLNEKRCIISSMNLYEFSTSNSKEIAIIVEDQETLVDIKKYIQEELIDISELVTERTSDKIVKGVKGLMNFVSNKLQNNEPRSHQTTSFSAKTHSSDRGYCIRCHTSIKSNPDKPLCAACYEKWKVYGKPTYKEKYCHICGNQEQTSLEKPVCKSCYSRFK
jgi:hypothetical protein